MELPTFSSDLFDTAVAVYLFLFIFFKFFALPNVAETSLSVEMAQKIVAGDVQAIKDILQEHPSMVSAYDVARMSRQN